MKSPHNPIKLTLRTPLLKRMGNKFFPPVLAPKPQSTILVLYLASRLRGYKHGAASMLKTSKSFVELMRENLARKYKQWCERHATESINRIIYNDRAHLVSVFKDHLIYDDSKELLVQCYNHKRSVRMLKELVRENERRFVFSTFSLCENKIFKKATMKRAKIRKLESEDLKRHANASTFFGTTFMNSLEDVSNSISKINSNSLETSVNDVGKIKDLLTELNTIDQFDPHVVKLAEITANTIPKAQPSNTSSTHMKQERKKEIIQKRRLDLRNAVPLNKAISSCKDRARAVLANAKPFSSNALYFQEEFLLENKSKERVNPVVTYNAFGLRLSAEIKKSIGKNALKGGLVGSLASSECEERKCAAVLPFELLVRSCRRRVEETDYFGARKKRNSHCLKQIRSPLLIETARKSNGSNLSAKDMFNARSILKKFDNCKARVKILNAREQLQKILSKA